MTEALSYQYLVNQQYPGVLAYHLTFIPFNKKKSAEPGTPADQNRQFKFRIFAYLLDKLRYQVDKNSLLARKKYRGDKGCVSRGKGPQDIGRTAC